MSNTKDAMNEQLGQAKILPLLVRLAIPATAAQLVNALYSIVDRMYIGHMPGDGTLALSGIGLTFPITMLIAAFSCLPGMGGFDCSGGGQSEKSTEISLQCDHAAAGHFGCHDGGMPAFSGAASGPVWRGC